MIQVSEVNNKRDLKQFVTFPFKLYKDCPYWVPPLIKDEMETLNMDKNPVARNAEARYFLAYKDGKIAGRIAVIINNLEVNELGKKKVRFGWFDVIDDIEVTRSLLEKAYEFGRSRNLEYIEGPVGFSNMEKAGMLELKRGLIELKTS